MRIALIGYGNMGKTIEKIALSRGHEINLRLSLENKPENWQQLLAEADVAIEFTSPDAAVEHIRACFNAGTPVVVGTTGWYKDFAIIQQEAIANNAGMFYASNFSIGVNLFFALNKYLAALMKPYNEYQLNLEEVHHIHKKDAPSGTAITLAEGIISQNDAYHAWSGQIAPATSIIPINSIRENEVPGTHIIRYTSEIDRIEISHTAFSRTGFAQGAVMAAEFMRAKKGIYTMPDLLNINTPDGN